jgi:hypothetical protein
MPYVYPNLVQWLWYYWETKWSLDRRLFFKSKMDEISAEMRKSDGWKEEYQKIEQDIEEKSEWLKKAKPEFDKMGKRLETAIKRAAAQ